jgi:hypothetical protein
MSQPPARCAVLTRSAPGRERRDAARYACHIETSYYVLNEILSRPRPGCVVNLSTTGMTLVVERALGRNSLLGAEVESPSRGRSYLVVGRVVRALAYGDSWLVACSFDRPLSREDAAELV